ncbi:SNF2 family N-terminal domain-containing protein [Apodospora peruviana]|uniref:SNF2 family N-terminal domain-containing protein n=1 Tax=Apodospora peruviana TaxID=516989 RepID=A0AAE0I028_9PEZI|nr:SNF2 family N-terminal domain-containing protein [Apodospora peruviana]
MMAAAKRPWPYPEEQQQNSYKRVVSQDLASYWDHKSIQEIPSDPMDYRFDLEVDSLGPKPSTYTNILGQDPSEREICFGSIIDVKAQLRQEPPSVYDYSAFQSFKIGAHSGTFVLELPSGEKLATLNKKTCRDIQLLLDGRDLRFHAYVEIDQWDNAVRAWRDEKSTAILSMDINIYGSQKDAAQVGKILADNRTYLQQPNHGIEGTAYYNPHYLHVEDLLGKVSSETPILQMQDIAPSPQLEDPTEHGSQEEEQQLDESQEIDSILNSLSHHAILPNRHTSNRRIRTKLLPHQEDAMDFVMQRETGALPQELSLWNVRDADTDQPFVQHVITGAKSDIPKDARGGIIADEMGLGKTLVILSTIAGSLDQATDFVLEGQGRDSSPATQQKIRSKATLVIAPSSLLIDSWADEICNHAYPGYLTFHKHHGQRRQEPEYQQRLLQTDIVLTTYATVAAEAYRGQNNILGQIHWFRIVLDEAHDIRNRSTKQHQAAANLVSQHRWCLTGTPIQNSVEDLGALVAFLKVPILENSATFRKFIATPSTSKSGDRFKNLRLLLKSICIRRTRDLLNLPEPDVKIKQLEFSPAERQEYHGMHLQCRQQVDRAVSGHGKGSLNAVVLKSLLRLRLFCNNGTTGRWSSPTGDPDEILSYLQQQDRADCAYCFNPVYSINDSHETDGGMLISDCMHLVCRNCIPQHMSRKGKSCPLCVAGNTNRGDSEIMSQLQDEDGSFSRAVILPQSTTTQFPSKIQKFLEDVLLHPHRKSIAFSCWKKTLDLMGQILKSRGIRYYSIHGSLSLAERTRVLTAFKMPAGANILLMTLGTGAVGLNLAVASRIYLMEPQWNPSVQLQAIGRSLRLGQTDQVNIIHYIMKDTVEDVCFAPITYFSFFGSVANEQLNTEQSPPAPVHKDTPCGRRFRKGAREGSSVG